MNFKNYDRAADLLYAYKLGQEAFGPGAANAVAEMDLKFPVDAEARAQYDAGYQDTLGNQTSVAEPSAPVELVRNSPAFDRDQIWRAGQAAKMNLDYARYDDDWGFAVRGTATFWNPLKNGNDAIRLVVALNLDILQDPRSSPTSDVEVIANESLDPEYSPWAWEKRDPDPVLALFRAITACAAAIQRQQENPPKVD